MGPPLIITSFAEHRECWRDCPGPVVASAFDALSTREQDACWAGLNEACRQDVEDDYAYERQLREEPPKRRHQPARRSTASSWQG